MTRRDAPGLPRRPIRSTFGWVAAIAVLLLAMGGWAAAQSDDDAGFYAAQCAGCHGAAGEGGPGGSLQTSTMSLEEIAAVIADGTTGMPGYADSLDDAALDALTAYVAGFQTATPSATTAVAPTSGYGIYAANCAGCHGPSGEGNTAGSVHSTALTVEDIAAVTRNGMRGMPGYADVLTAEQIAAVARFVFDLEAGVVPVDTPSAEPPTPTGQDPITFDNEYCLGCHLQEGFETTLPSGEVLDLTFDLEAFESSVHGVTAIPCALCHTNITPYPHEPITSSSARAFTDERADACVGCHLDEDTEAADNVHAAAREAGNAEAAVCTDCHGAHDTVKPIAHSPEVPLTCRQCHSEVYQLYEESVHGEALNAANRDVPTCTDCHGVHNVEGPSDSPFHLFSPQICADCHTDEDLMEPYGLSTRVLETYVADFHGSTVILFEKLAPDQQTNKPVCIDCHGVHAIRSADDPEGTVFQANLLQTCQRCHPDATENFSAAWLSHYSPEPGKATLVWLAGWLYRILIPVVISGMLVFVVASASRRRRARKVVPG